MATTFTGPDGQIQFERLTQPIYDSAIVANGATSATFFGSPVGGGTSAWNGSGSKTLEDTNMTVAGSLPAGYTFHLRGIGMQLQPVITMPDIQAITKLGAFQLKIAAKDQFQGPLIWLPQACGVDGVTTATTVSGVHNGIADPRAIFPIDQEITILPNQNITARIDWGTALTLSASQPVRLVFYGWLDRPVQ